MKFDLIIFDCDGTLVDTEYLHNVVIADLLTSLGHPQFTVQHNLEHFAGLGMEAAVAKIEAETGRQLPATFLRDYIAEVTRRFATELKVIEGVLETLARLRGRVKICVASNGEHDNVMASLVAGRLTEFFPDASIFTKAQVAYPKPAPDLFLFAAKKMGADPARTLVIEDSVTGARAGVAAGMTVVGLTAAAHDPEAQGAALRREGVHHLLHRFADVEALVAN